MAAAQDENKESLSYRPGCNDCGCNQRALFRIAYRISSVEKKSFFNAEIIFYQF